MESDIHTHQHHHGHGHCHEHEHSHGHHHHHSVNIESLNNAFIIGILLNSAFVVFEFVAGMVSSSAGLLSDAGHNLSDVASLLLALFAFRLTKVGSSKTFTYGYKKSTILISLLNALILLIAVGLIIYESVEKIVNPITINGGTIAWVAAVGVVINGLTAWLFLKDKDKDLNVKGAYLHMAADALVSVGVVVSGIAIKLTGINIIDPIIGLAIAFAIIISTWNLLQDSVRLALDGVPSNIDTEELVSEIKAIDNIVDIHHLHVWAISTTENAATAHIVVNDLNDMQRIKMAIKAEMAEHGIGHATLEFEEVGCECNETCRCV